MEQVEDHVVDRGVLDPPLHDGGVGQAHPPLQQLKAWASVIAERDDLAVKDGIALRQLLGDRRQLGIPSGDVLESAALHSPGAAVRVAERTDAVPLDLVSPAIVLGLGQSAWLGEHRLERGWEGLAGKVVH